MSATWCLGPFAERIRKMPRNEWKGEIDKLPERCTRGCGVQCRNVCIAYAKVQWRMASLRKRAMQERGQ